jgi:DNA-binding winged helix-turn-helix (wHTH) protein
MATEAHSSARLAFGPFEVDLDRKELLRNGTRLRLAPQPFEILLLLLARRGEVVTREQLREQLWPQGTFVDFEHGLNAAINKLRRCLADSAEKPRYIETVPGRGYCFVGDIEQRSTAQEEPGYPNVQPVATNSANSNSKIFTDKSIWIAACALSTAFGLWGIVTVIKGRPVPPARPVLQFTIGQPAGTIFVPPVSRQPFAISPDGRRMAFTATGPKGTGIWVRDLAEAESRYVPGTDGAWAVFWSKDSRSFFYSTKRTLKEANLDTHSTRSVATLPIMPMFGAWRSNTDLVLYLAPHLFYELATNNGNLRQLSRADMRWMQFLPAGDRFLHIVWDTELSRYRAVTTNPGGRSDPLIETDSRVEYAPPAYGRRPGHLLYIRDGTLVAQAFDAKRVRLAGEPLPIAPNVTYFRPSASACFSVSDNGVLIYQTGFPVSELNWYDRAGRVIGAAAPPAPYGGQLRISPDARRVAAAVWNTDSGTLDTWEFESNNTGGRRLTFPPESTGRVVWSPDGQRLALSASRSGAPHLAILTAEDKGHTPALKFLAPVGQPDARIQTPTDWSPDGRFIAFDSSSGEEEREVWLADVQTRKMTPFLQGGYAQWGAVFSPDGSRVAFVSEKSGRPEIYVQRVDMTHGPELIEESRKVSREGAWTVRWRPDGREVFFVTLDNTLYAVPVNGELRFGEPKAMFRIEGAPQYGSASDFQFDVTRDGQRLIMTSTGSVAPSPFTVVENWEAKFDH